jgi:CheY-like chemotaxis protein/anti-sigma regulatory factor (Ser/Thr protein kinase)
MSNRILITDTDKSAADRIVSGLDAELSTATVALDTVDTLATLADKSYDLAVIDIDLPQTGGLELLKTIRQQDPDLRLILSSPREEYQEIIEAMVCDASNYLTKPYTAEELQKAVTHAMAESQAVEHLDVNVGQEGWIELMMPSSLNYMTRLDRFFKLFYKSEIPEDQFEEISYCFKEITKNAIDWGHNGDVKKKVKISHVLFQDQFCFKIEDQGEGYNVQKALYGEEELDMEEMEEERLELGLRPGGLGMTIVKEMMDDIIPNAKGNITILSKYL